MNLAGNTTGDLNIHDVALDGEGNPLFINARFSCLATISDRYQLDLPLQENLEPKSLRPLWSAGH